MTDAASPASTGTPAPSPKPRHWLSIGMMTVAAIETFGALYDLPGAFEDFGHQTRLLIVAQALTQAKLLIAPVLAGAALVLAIMRRLRPAIVALGILVLVAWAAELPSIAIHGFEFSATVPGALLIAQRLVYPVLAVAAIGLALRTERLGLATLLVSLPAIIAIAAILAFAAAVMMYGF